MLDLAISHVFANDFLAWMREFTHDYPPTLDAMRNGNYYRIHGQKFWPTYQKRPSGFFVDQGCRTNALVFSGFPAHLPPQNQDALRLGGAGKAATMGTIKEGDKYGAVWRENLKRQQETQHLHDKCLAREYELEMCAYLI